MLLNPLKMELTSSNEKMVSKFSQNVKTREIDHLRIHNPRLRRWTCYRVIEKKKCIMMECIYYPVNVLVRTFFLRDLESEPGLVGWYIFFWRGVSLPSIAYPHPLFINHGILDRSHAKGCMMPSSHGHAELQMCVFRSATQQQRLDFQLISNCSRPENGH